MLAATPDQPGRWKSTRRTSVFVSYSHVDGEWERRLAPHLGALGRAMDVRTWDDRRIDAGAEWEQVIRDAIRSADVAVLLLSADFLSSTFIHEVEVPLLLEQRERGVTTVIPFLVRPCVWEAHSWLSPLQMRPSGARAVSEYDHPDDALSRLAREIGLLARRESLRSARDGTPPQRTDALLAQLEEALRTCWDTESQPRRIHDGMAELRADAESRVARRRTKVPVRTAGVEPRGPVKLFKDRVDEQDRIAQLLLDPDTRVVTVVGRGGIGKTALVCRVLHGLLEGRWPRPPDGQELAAIVYLSTITRGITLDRVFSECSEVLPAGERDELMRMWAHPGTQVDEKIERLLKALHGGCYIILLDNVEDLLDERNHLTDPHLAQLIAVALRVQHAVKFVITSRRPIALPSPTAAYREVPLVSGLPLPEGARLLRELLEASPDAQLASGASDDALALISERFYGIPRALELAAGMLLNDPLLTADEITARFERPPREHGPAEPIVSELAREAYGRLDDDALHVMEALAVFGVPVPEVGVDYLLRPFFPGIEAPAVIRRLCRTHLAWGDRQTKRVSLHPIDRDFLYQLLPETGRYCRRELHKVAAQFYAERQVVGPTEWQDISETDHHVLEVQHLVRAGEVDEAARKLRRVGNAMSWRGFPEKTRSLLALMDGRVTAPDAKLAFHVTKCANLTVSGPLGLAILHGARAVRHAAALGDAAAEAYAHRRLALAYRYTGRRNREAVAHFSEAIALNTASDCSQYNPMLVFETSIAHAYLGDGEAALAAARQALALLEGPSGARLSDGQRRDTAAYAWSGMGFAHYICGRYEESLDAEAQALELVRRHSRDEALSGYALHIVALVHAARLEYGQAGAHWESALAIARRQGQPRLEGLCSHNLAVLACAAGDDARAIDLASRARTLLSPMHMGGASRAFVEFLRSRGSDPAVALRELRTCHEESARCPDFFGSGLLVQWIQNASRH